MVTGKFNTQGLLARNLRFFVSLVLLLLLAGLPFAPTFSGLISVAKAAVTPLQITNYVLISKRKASGSQFDYTYQATATNAGTATAFEAKAEAESLNPAIKLKNHNLKFGTVPAGGSVPSRDTFTLRKTETTVFNPADCTGTSSKNSPQAPMQGLTRALPSAVPSTWTAAVPAMTMKTKMSR